MPGGRGGGEGGRGGGAVVVRGLTRARVWQKPMDRAVMVPDGSSLGGGTFSWSQSFLPLCIDVPQRKHKSG